MTVDKKYVKKNNKIKATFKLDKKDFKDIESAFLLCEHDGWNPIELSKLSKGGFKVDVLFDADAKQKQYQYRYRLIDKNGIEIYDNDRAADYYVPNPFGGENSVIDLTINVK